MAILSAFGIGEEQWTLLDEGGETAVTFSSFLDLDVTNDGEATSYPVEEGGFANYNKVTSPIEIKVTLAVQGDDADFEDVLTKLQTYKTDAVKLQVSTPSWLYESMTLESFSYKRESGAGAGMLVVELNLIEIREVASQTTQVTVKSTATSSKSDISSPKNATSASSTNTGKTQPKNEPTSSTDNSSGLYKQVGKVNFATN